MGGGRVAEPRSSPQPSSALHLLPVSAAPPSHPPTVPAEVVTGSATWTMAATTVTTTVATRAAGAATADAVQAARSCLGGPGDCRLGRWCLAGYGRRRRFADLHPGPVGCWRCRAMTMQATQTPTHSVAEGSVDRDSAFMVLIVLGFGAVFVAVWPPLAMSLSGSR